MRRVWFGRDLFFGIDNGESFADVSAEKMVEISNSGNDRCVQPLGVDYGAVWYSYKLLFDSCVYRFVYSY